MASFPGDTARDVENQLDAIWGRICEAVDTHFHEVKPLSQGVLEKLDSELDADVFLSLRDEVDPSRVLDAWKDGCSGATKLEPSSPRSGADSHTSTTGSAGSGANRAQGQRNMRDASQVDAVEGRMAATPRASSRRVPHSSSESLIIAPRDFRPKEAEQGLSSEVCRENSRPTDAEAEVPSLGEDSVWKKVAYLDRAPVGPADCCCLLCKPSSHVFVVQQSALRVWAGLKPRCRNPNPFAAEDVSACVLGQCPRNEEITADPDASFTTGIILLQPAFQHVAVDVDKLGVHVRMHAPRHDLTDDPDSYLNPATQPNIVSFPLDSIEGFMAATEPLGSISTDARSNGDGDLFNGAGSRTPHVVYIHVREPSPSPIAGLRRRQHRDDPRRRFLLALSLASHKASVMFCRSLEGFVDQRLTSLVSVGGIPEAMRLADDASNLVPGMKALKQMGDLDTLGLRISELGEAFWHFPDRHIAVKASRGVGEVIDTVQSRPTPPHPEFPIGVHSKPPEQPRADQDDCDISDTFST